MKSFKEYIEEGKIINALATAGIVAGGMLGHVSQANANQQGSSVEERQKFVAGKHSQAFLDTLSYAEGTDQYDNNGYHTHFGGSQSPDAIDHPNKVITSKNGISSTAFGRYQILHKTYKDIGMTSMLPDEQDRGALLLAARRLKFKTLDQLENHLAKNGMDNTTFDAISREWASITDSTGKGVYGQPTKTIDQVRRKYQERLDGNTSTIPQPKITDNSTGSYHSVAGGDTLSGIAQRNKTTVAELLRHNPSIKDPNKIKVGQQIKTK